MHKDDDCQCKAVKELECRLEHKRGEFVAVATTGGDVKFGWVDDVDDGILELRYVCFFSPACPCEPVFAFKALVPVYQITDVLKDPHVDDDKRQAALDRLNRMRDSSASQ
jgi:hypothetical protein